MNIGSYACFFGFPQIGAYAASKGGLAQLTRVLAVKTSRMAFGSTPSELAMS